MPVSDILLNRALNFFHMLFLDLSIWIDSKLVCLDSSVMYTALVTKKMANSSKKLCLWDGW